VTTTVPWAAEALAHADALYNLARYLSTRADEAEDLVQETYAKALAGAETFRGGNLKAWLFTILRHVLVDLRRKGKGFATPHELEVIEGGEANLPQVEPVALGRLVASDLQAAIRSLSDDARALILLDAEGFTETEMAAILGCALGTVKSRLSRGRQALRQQLQDYAQ
jgi:RNA polymerase sigma-70 factor (ECF subfamily)